MKLLTIIAFSLLFMGCAKIHLICPTAGTTTVSVGGSTVGLQALAMGQAAAKVAGVMATAPGLEPTVSTVDYSYVPIFGSDNVSCNVQGPQPPTPAPVIITIPSGPPAPQVLKP